MLLKPEKEVSPDQAIRSLVQKNAQLYYRGLSIDGQAEIRADFIRLDDSEDGKISLQEFLTGLQCDQLSSVTKIFKYLDADGNGFLDFDEFVTLYYLVAAELRICDNCGCPIMIMGYTCKSCWGERAREDASTFDLCLDCYSSRGFVHHHDNFVDDSSMYNSLLSNTNAESLKQVQCSVCGDFHRKDSKSVLVGEKNHIIKSTEGSDCYICEFCSSWLCNNCGKFFEGPESTAAPNKWLETNLRCQACGVHGNMSNLNPVFEALAKCELNGECSTCAIKIKKGTLWATHRNRSGEGASSSSSSSTSANDPLKMMLEIQAMNNQVAMSNALAQSIADIGRSFHI